RTRPVVRNEHGVGPDGGYDVRLELDRAAPACDSYPLAVDHPETRCEPRVHLDLGLGLLGHERTDAARLRPGEELRDHAAGGEDDRIRVVDVLGRRAVGNRMEARAAIRVMEAAALEEARRASMVRGRTGPEDAHVALEPLVGDAAVVG